MYRGIFAGVNRATGWEELLHTLGSGGKFPGYVPGGEFATGQADH